MDEVRLDPAGALIFDLDGVIADSGDAHYVAWRDLCAKFDVALTRHDFDSRIFGRRNMEIFPDLLGDGRDQALRERLSEEKEILFRAEIPRSVRPVPGVVDFIRRAKAAGMPVVVGSSAPRANVDVSLAYFGLGDGVDEAVCGDEVERGKPDPEVFVKAARKVARAPEASIVFEDAPSGVRAGVAAGARVIGIETTNPARLLTDAGAERTAPDFTRLRPVLG